MRPNFIIGGTNKAGTTSVFRYFSEHPEVCGSNVKETGFFLRNNLGDIEGCLAELSEYYSHCEADHKILVEASTSYLARADEAMPRIKSMLDEPKILFILREPTDRIFSYFNFQKAHLALPETLSFEEYLELCRQYEDSCLDGQDVAFEERHLRAVRNGKYSIFIKRYQEEFPRANVKVMFFDDLKSSPAAFMRELSLFAGVSPDFYDDYQFKKTNVTFSSKSRMFHKFAGFLNRKLERFLRQRPQLKGKLVAIYKRLNMARQGYDEMEPKTREWLRSYYSESKQDLPALIGRPLPDSWQ